MKKSKFATFFGLVLAAAAVLNSGQLAAQEKGFSLEDSIRHQVFQELRINVEHLYQNSRLIKGERDNEDVIARTAQTGFVVPALVPENGQAENRGIDLIN